MDAFVRLATSASGVEADPSTLNEIVAVGKEAQELRPQVEDAIAKAWLRLAATGDRLGDLPGWANTAGSFANHIAVHGPEADFLDAIYSSIPEMDEEARRRLLDTLRKQYPPQTADGGESDNTGRGGDDKGSDGTPSVPAEP